ncbi:kinase-like protein [Aspergillus indologenus CBS 114.80]|uniref:Kinase-like protein n=1 Tax=Aspergillus indologenus CBS 114.80 TaxID=1450541 RepID=A0A2V5IYZ4_9EURO|nr:kinase-like protein [Aspergillus indologenus CBS 114.80]
MYAYALNRILSWWVYPFHALFSVVRRIFLLPFLRARRSVADVERPGNQTTQLLCGEVLGIGSTASIIRVGSGTVLKSPHYARTQLSKETFEEIKKSFKVEEEIISILGTHPRIIQFLGVSQDPPGLLLAEACGGNLQTYLDQHVGMTSLALRLRWCSQSAEAIAFIHQKGVIHSDLRLDCYLLQHNDLLLCDFGGSSTTSGSIDGGHLPDSGFFNPNKPWVSTREIDIFSLGSVLYTIMTDHWPYRSPGPFTSMQEKELYSNTVDELFGSNKFPSTDNLIGGHVMQRCWEGQYDRVEEILHDQASCAVDSV